MPKVHFVKKARKDYPDFGIKAGDSYYHWTLKTGPTSSITRKSKDQPKPSQLTTSAFKSAYLGIVEGIPGRFTDFDCIQDEVDSLVSELQDLLGETQSSLDNMPEGLQQGSTGELLQERIDGLDNWITEIQALSIPELEEGLEEDSLEEAKKDALESFISEIEDTDPGLG